MVNKLKEVLLGKKRFTNAIFHYASGLGVHAAKIKEPKKLYEPKPYSHGAEFAVLQTMPFLNHLKGLRTMFQYAVLIITIYCQICNLVSALH